MVQYPVPDQNPFLGSLKQRDSSVMFPFLLTCGSTRQLSELVSDCVVLLLTRIEITKLTKMETKFIASSFTTNMSTGKAKKMYSTWRERSEGSRSFSSLPADHAQKPGRNRMPRSTFSGGRMDATKHHQCFFLDNRICRPGKITSSR